MLSYLIKAANYILVVVSMIWFVDKTLSLIIKNKLKVAGKVDDRSQRRIMIK